MSKGWIATALLLIAATVGSYAYLHAAHEKPAAPIATDSITCGKHHCSNNSICCPSCATGELRCSSGPRCPECAPR